MILKAEEFQNNLEYARFMDDIDSLFSIRHRFQIPEKDGKQIIYFCGNSLGLKPASTAYLMDKELKKWGDLAVDGHFAEEDPWFSYSEDNRASLARIVGAKMQEVIPMNSLTVNLHLLMISFYKPTKERYKIIMEGGAFPSDQYAMETQVRMHGLNPEEVIIELHPREGEYTLREEDIFNTIEEHGESLALVMMAGVHYYTGQYYPLREITEKAHKVGALCGFDLAHATGNLPLELHDWNVDFACWCSYKYLNSGPGAVGVAFVHEKWANDPDVFRLGGWWGNDPKTRFKMEKGFLPAKGAQSWQMSNAPVFNMIGLKASMDIFDTVAMADLRKKSIALTNYLYFLLNDLTKFGFKIITPENPNQRGAQLSLLFKDKGKELFDYLTENGVVMDWREPNVIRIAPVPLYNTFEEVYTFAKLVENYFNQEN
ncbi:MAG TPA: kynureninase [Chitinophagaceae bacterium]|nr:kynureninase [Chitinophagaceae bacterium]